MSEIEHLKQPACDDIVRSVSYTMYMYMYMYIYIHHHIIVCVILYLFAGRVSSPWGKSVL